MGLAPSVSQRRIGLRFALGDWTVSRLPAASVMASDLRLKLFVAGDSPRAREAAANLARAVAALEDGAAQVETVDVLKHPEAADQYRILTTPTVLREAPAPRRRVTGDLRDTAQVLAALALFPATPLP